MANEVAHSINFARAFDSINWQFLEDAMSIMNFPKKWIVWIKSILLPAKPSVLINGSPSRKFSMKQGLRHGDPMSPLIFNLVGEILSKFLEKATKLGIIQGISLDANTSISHLQFADVRLCS